MLKSNLDKIEEGRPKPASMAIKHCISRTDLNFVVYC